MTVEPLPDIVPPDHTPLVLMVKELLPLSVPPDKVSVLVVAAAVKVAVPALIVVAETL